MSRTALAAVLLATSGVAIVSAVPAAMAQAPVAAGRVQGTVKTISGSTITVVADAGGATSTVTVADGARIQQSADLKTVSPSTLDQLAVGDKVLMMGTAGDGGSFSANRVIMIKSAAIAERNQSSQADWAKRGSGGIVKSVDPAAKTVTISSGARTITLNTTGTTVFRRYAPGSVKFEDAKPGTLADLQPGDQLRVRGDKTPDGTSVAAEEVVSGSFTNLSGTIVSVNAAANSLVIKDLATKKNATVLVSDASDVRNLPPEMAARFAPRPAGGAGGARGGGAGAPAGGGAPAGDAAAGGAPGGAPAGGGRPGGPGGAGGPGGGFGGRGPGGRGGAGDLAALIPRLPKATLADFKNGQALMIVASGSAAGPVTAVTVLSGVEPLLTGPAGSGMSISPWSLGGGAGGGGGEGGGGGGGPE